FGPTAAETAGGRRVRGDRACARGAGLQLVDNAAGGGRDGSSLPAVATAAQDGMMLCRFEWLWRNFAPAPAGARSLAAAPSMSLKIRRRDRPWSATPRRAANIARRAIAPPVIVSSAAPCAVSPAPRPRR